MRKISTALSVIALIAGGCAAPPSLPSVPADHPANPDAIGPAMPTAAAAGVTPPATMAMARYTCPMHPDVVTNGPGTCPKCGMTLVKKEGPE